MAVSETLKGTLHFRSCLAHPRLTAVRFNITRRASPAENQKSNLGSPFTISILSEPLYLVPNCPLSLT